MIPQGQKTFTFKFSPDERVVVSQGSNAGNRGYIDSIRVDRNGILCNVILTEFINLDSCHYKPKVITIFEHWLEPIKY